LAAIVGLGGPVPGILAPGWTAIVQEEEEGEKEEKEDEEEEKEEAAGRQLT